MQVNRIPDRVWGSVLSYLPVEEVGKVGEVCKPFQRVLSKDSGIWGPLARQNFPIAAHQFTNYHPRDFFYNPRLFANWEITEKTTQHKGLLICTRTKQISQHIFATVYEGYPGLESRIKIWTQGKILQELLGQTCCERWNDNELVTRDQKGNLCFWEVASGKKIKDIPCPSNGTEILKLDDRNIAIDDKGSIIILDVDTNEQSVMEIDQSKLRCLIKMDPRTIACGSFPRSDQISIADFKNKKVSVLSGHTDWLRSLYKLTNGNLVSSSNDKTIRIWDGRTYEQLRTIQCEEEVWPIEQLNEVAMIFPEKIHSNDTVITRLNICNFRSGECYRKLDLDENITSLLRVEPKTVLCTTTKEVGKFQLRPVSEQNAAQK